MSNSSDPDSSAPDNDETARARSEGDSPDMSAAIHQLTEATNLVLSLLKPSEKAAPDEPAPPNSAASDSATSDSDTPGPASENESTSPPGNDVPKSSSSYKRPPQSPAGSWTRLGYSITEVASSALNLAAHQVTEAAQRMQGQTDSVKRQETRTSLLEAAFTLFTEKGIEAASINEIAAQAGYTKGAVYSHFGSKEELILATVEQFLSCPPPSPAELHHEIVALRSGDFSGFQVTAANRQMLLFKQEAMMYAVRHPEHRAVISDFLESQILALAEVVREERVARASASTAADGAAAESGKPGKSGKSGKPTQNDIETAVALGLMPSLLALQSGTDATLVTPDTAGRLALRLLDG